MDKRKHVILGISLVALTVVFSPAVLRAATEDSDTADSAQSEPSTPLSRAIAAGKKVSSGALSSRAKEANAETVPAKTEQTQLSDFQKKIAAIKQGEASGEDKTLSDFPIQAVSSGKKAVVTKKAVATKTLKDEAKEEGAVDPNAPKPVKRETAGIVTGINSRGIGVEYAQDKKAGGREVWIPFSEKAKRSGALKDLSGLEVGDKVGAVYDEYPDLTKQLTRITLLKKKPTEKESEAM